jgi:hypothetical protein
MLSVIYGAGVTRNLLNEKPWKKIADEKLSQHRLSERREKQWQSTSGGTHRKRYFYSLIRKIKRNAEPKI